MTFVVAEHWTALDPHRHYSVVPAGRARAVDHYRSRASAEHHARMLNAGRASVNPHAVVGCKVEVGA